MAQHNSAWGLGMIPHDAACYNREYSMKGGRFTYFNLGGSTLCLLLLGLKHEREVDSHSSVWEVVLCVHFTVYLIFLNLHRWSEWIDNFIFMNSAQGIWEAGLYSAKPGDQFPGIERGSTMPCIHGLTVRPLFHFLITENSFLVLLKV